MKRTARAILSSIVAAVCANANLAAATWQNVQLENGNPTSNNWFFFPDEQDDPRLIVKGNQNGQLVPLKVLDGGPPEWIATSSETVLASGLSTFVPTGSGSGKLISAHLEGTRSIKVVDFVAGEAVAVETAVGNIPGNIAFGGLSAAVDSAGLVHIAYTLGAAPGATGCTLGYARRNASTGDWGKQELSIPARILATSIVAPTTSSAVMYFTTVGLHRCNLDSFANGQPLMTDFTVPHVPAQGIVSGALKATRVGSIDRILFFYATGSTTWQFARMHYSNSSNFETFDVQDVGAVSGSPALPLSIHVSKGANGKEHIAWYDLRSRRIHYLTPGAGADGLPYNASQPVTLPNQPVGVPESDLQGLHVRDSDGLAFLLYRRSPSQGFISYIGPDVPRPDIAVQTEAGLNVLDGRSVNFGSIGTDAAKVLSFTIRNLGIANLNGITPTILTSPTSGDYTIETAPATSLAPGASTTLTLRFTPGANGKRNAKLQIASNDMDENPFDIALLGVGTPPQIPEITVNSGRTVLTDGTSEVLFGNVTTGTTRKPMVLSITNSGLAALTGVVATIDGANAADFTITRVPLPTIAGRKRTTMMIAFAPGAVGERTAVLHIASNDADENPFDIVLKGAGIPPFIPEIAIEQPAGTDLTDGVAERDFGPVDLGGNTLLTFTVHNTGIAPLKGLAAAFVGGNLRDFVVTARPPKLLAAGASTTFTVSFKPLAAGLRTTTLRVVSNDANERFFEIALKGTAVAPAAAAALTAETGPGHPFLAAIAAAGLEGLSADPEAVPHGDGVGNLIKYAFNLNLAGPDHRTLVPSTGTAGLPVLASTTADGNTTLRFEYIRRKDAGLDYQPKLSADLVSWSSPDGDPIVSPIDDKWERVVYELSPAQSRLRFCIVDVSVIPD